MVNRPFVGRLQVDAPDGLRMVVGVGGIVGVVIAGQGGGRIGHQLVAFVEALLVFTHVQVNAGQQGRSSLPRGISLVGTSDKAPFFVLSHILFGGNEVGDNGVIDLAHRGAGRRTLGNRCQTERNAHVVTSLHVRHRIQRHHVEMAEGAEEVVLTHQVIVHFRLFRLLQNIHIAVGDIDDLVGHPPGIVDILGGVVIGIAVGIDERVLGDTGNRHVVTAELRELEVVADIVVAAFAAFLSLIGDSVLEKGVDTVGGIEGRIGIFGKFLGGQGVGAIEVHVAGHHRHGSEPDCESDYKYLFHNA